VGRRRGRRPPGETPEARLEGWEAAADAFRWHLAALDAEGWRGRADPLPFIFRAAGRTPADPWRVQGDPTLAADVSATLSSVS
jgi:hypothetical protein